MKATVVGAAVPAKTLRTACAKADVPGKDVRAIGTRAWIELPNESRDLLLPRLAEALGTGLMVVDVEAPAGLRADGMIASRATYRGVEEDITTEAQAIVNGWASANRRVDDTDVARQLAWALIEAEGDGANPAESNIEDIWAHALFARLLSAGSIELRDTHPPFAGIAQVLQNPGRDLGERLLAELIDSSAIDEVFADAEELARAARETRPKRS